jgi:hypothetical protein
MNLLLKKELAALDRMSVDELREKHRLVFGEENRSRHKDYLRKRIAWRLQSLAEGGLSERARKRAEELANDADLRIRMPAAPQVTPDAEPRTEVLQFVENRDTRLPMPGTVLSRRYRGQDVRVTVLNDGFEFEGEVFRSLTAIAKAVTGSHWNGMLFFGLTKKEVAR